MTSTRTSRVQHALRRTHSIAIIAARAGLPARANRRAKAYGQLWDKREELRKLIERDYCRPVIDRLIALARENEVRGRKRKAWHAALSRWADTLQLSPVGAAWGLETFIPAHLKIGNVAGIAIDLGLAAGLDAHLAELARLDDALRSRPAPLIWNG
jgi:hypothetical protein